eukprot:TRINITY_DN862_c1_g2_i3.p1 TRINITY_DN862_c1_g2~~TRINITY_DN862_c1_g2_i3.p1  ORF type:complete len:104 (+),score=5.60 TRINITY_DN862_c1_g2_i3:40-351(+)
MPKIFTRERKDKYMANLRQNLDNCNQVIVISVDNVGSKQIQQIRMALRGMATIVMGKNVNIISSTIYHPSLHPHCHSISIYPSSPVTPLNVSAFFFSFGFFFL